MNIHCVSYYERPNGETLVDVAYQCSARCMADELGLMADEHLEPAGAWNTPDGSSVSWGGWPGGSETDYPVYCSACSELLWRGLQTETVNA